MKHDPSASAEMFDALARLHESVDASRKLAMIEPWLVRDLADGSPLWKSYLPFVGPHYRPGGILLVATAQNLAKCTRKPELWKRATGQPHHPLYRQYRGPDGVVQSRPLTASEVRFQNIEMAPWLEGILPGLVGLALFGLGVGRFESLDEVTANIALTNFFKHSLITETGNDLNPLAGLDRKTAAAYLEATQDCFVRQELEILRPSVILAFKGLRSSVTSVAHSAKILEINDPSWVKRGMSGFARAPSGKWYREVMDAAIPIEVMSLATDYVRQMSPTYSAGKAEATRVYLLHNYLAMQVCGWF